MMFQQLVRQLGAWCYFERELFSLVGGWAASSTDHEVKAYFATVCRHHAEHGDTLAALLPNAYAPSAEELVQPGPGAVVLKAIRSLESDADRVSGLCLIAVAGLLISYESYLAKANPVTDGPYLRAVRNVVTDLRDDLRAGEALLGSSPGGINGVDPMAHVRALLENRQVNTPFLGKDFADDRR